MGARRYGSPSRQLAGMIRQLAGTHERELIGLSKVWRMKTKHTALAIASLSLLALAGLCAPRLARAGAPEGLGTWEGTGATTEVDGRAAGTFTVKLTRTSPAAGTVRVDGKVRTTEGKEIAFWQETTERGGGRFRLTSSSGTGGGHCFANGMCQSLAQGADGQAAATTIAIDGHDKLRIIVTELKGGQAVRFHAQTLTKTP